MTLAMVVMPIALGACLATTVGGLFAVSLRERLHLVLGYSAGAVIAVAFFDLLPESIASGQKYFAAGYLLTLTAIGFFAYMMLDRFITLHGHGDEEKVAIPRGWLVAASLSAHSFLDGFVIGIAFQASRATGIVVAVAVLVHDFSDGLNTVNVVLKNGGSRGMALRWLAADALAPVVGAAVGLIVIFPADVLSEILALFAGFFLYIGASDLLPESQRAHPRAFTSFATLAGAAMLYLVTRIVG